jgi:hypothetical protein
LVYDLDDIDTASHIQYQREGRDEAGPYRDGQAAIEILAKQEYCEE